MRFTSSVAKSSAVFLQIHVPSPLPTQYNVERSKELCLDGFNTVCGVGEGVGTYSASSARVQFRVCQKAFELYNSPKTFVHDCSFSFFKYPIKPYFFILYFFNLVPRALFPGFGGGGKAPWGRA